MAEIKTWGQALDYTFKTRHSWRHGNGKKTSGINSGHFTRLRGRSFPIGKINQQVMTHVAIELEDEGKSDATINRVVSAVSTVLNHCAFDDLIPAAPKLRRRKEGESRRAYFTKDQHQQFLPSTWVEETPVLNWFYVSIDTDFYWDWYICARTITIHLGRIRVEIDLPNG